MTRVFVSRDAFSLALGADAVAAAFAPHATVVRTGSRGMAWLEPLVEVETPAGRIAYGPVAPADIPAILTGTARSLGLTDEIPFLKRQTRLTFARCGVVDPQSLDDYTAHGGLAALRIARDIGPAATMDVVLKSGLRRRGRAGRNR